MKMQTQKLPPCEANVKLHEEKNICTQQLSPSVYMSNDNSVEATDRSYTAECNPLIKQLN